MRTVIVSYIYQNDNADTYNVLLETICYNVLKEVVNSGCQNISFKNPLVIVTPCYTGQFRTESYNHTDPPWPLHNAKVICIEHAISHPGQTSAKKQAAEKMNHMVLYSTTC